MQRFAFVTCAVLVLSTSSAFAEEKKDKAAAQEAAMMAAWQAYATPGAGHAFLKSLVGSWTTVTKHWMDPSKPAEETQGACETKLILGDRYVEEVVMGTVMGQVFEGRGLTGFDNALQKYEGTWVDNMGTGIATSEGTLDKTGKILNAKAEMIDPMTKKKMTMRTVLTVESDAKHVFEMFSKIKGKEVKMMEVTYTKK